MSWSSPHAPVGSPWVESSSATLLLHHEPRSYRSPEPLSARIIGILFTLFTAGACAALFSHRICAVKSWSRLPYIRWLVLLQYAGAFIYTIFSAVVQYGLNPDGNASVCDASALVCITLYAIMKQLLYLFLADRLHVVRSSIKSRKKSKLFLVHTIGIGICIVVLAIIFIFLRLHYLEGDVCVIGVQRVMMIIGVTFDALINVYLTSFFLYYLIKSFNILPFRTWRSAGIQSLGSNERARPLRVTINKLTSRTTIGLGITLVATITNLTTMTLMNGEVIWLCFLTCKADILLCVLVLHYMSTGVGGRDRQRHHDSSTGPSVASRRAPPARTDEPLSLSGGNTKQPYLRDISPEPSPSRGGGEAAGMSRPPHMVHKPTAVYAGPARDRDRDCDVL
ncbi:hypothetical protein MN608_06692 [Microdochium nivale]|nr:hypothetical protein MN608_06692 [Microdochium nivale]